MARASGAFSDDAAGVSWYPFKLPWDGKASPFINSSFTPCGTAHGRGLPVPIRYDLNVPWEHEIRLEERRPTRPGTLHITMRITVPRQFAQGLENHDELAGRHLLEVLRRIKWHLWHGNVYRAHDEIADLQFDAEGLETDYPNTRKFLTAIGDFQSYIASNNAILINYGERYRSGGRVSSALSRPPSTPSSPSVSPRNSRCSGAGPAHLLLQNRTQTLDAPCAQPSGNGIPAWPTTIMKGAKWPAPPDRPTKRHAPLTQRPKNRQLIIHHVFLCVKSESARAVTSFPSQAQVQIQSRLLASK